MLYFVLFSLLFLLIDSIQERHSLRLWSDEIHFKILPIDLEHFGINQNKINKSMENCIFERNGK